jgi:two-component system, OmpR family, response regulator MprA
MATILLVDDDPDLVSTSRMVLENAGHTVVVASDPAEGRRAMDRHQPDVLILDVMMESPDDGIVMAQSLRREGNKTPILMLTSLPKVTGMGLVKDEEIVPVDELVEKPVAAKRLLDLVDQLLSRKR